MCNKIASVQLPDRFAAIDHLLEQGLSSVFSANLTGGLCLDLLHNRKTAF